MNMNHWDISACTRTSMGADDIHISVDCSVGVSKSNLRATLKKWIWQRTSPVLYYWHLFTHAETPHDIGLVNRDCCLCSSAFNFSFNSLLLPRTKLAKLPWTKWNASTQMMQIHLDVLHLCGKKKEVLAWASLATPWGAAEMISHLCWWFVTSHLSSGHVPLIDKEIPFYNSVPFDSSVGRAQDCCKSLACWFKSDLKEPFFSTAGILHGYCLFLTVRQRGWGTGLVNQGSVFQIWLGP